MTEQQRQEKQETDRIWLSQMLASAQSHKFYGGLEVIMEDGQIRRILERRTHVPPEPR